MALRKANIKLFNNWNDSSGQHHADAMIGSLNISLQFPWPMNTGGSIQLSSNQKLPVPDVNDFAGRLIHQVGFNSSLPPFHLVGVGSFGFSIETFQISFKGGNISSIQMSLSIPGWDALHKYQFKIVQPKLNLQLGFLTKTLTVRAVGFITALNQRPLHGLPIEVVFPKTLHDYLEIRVADENAIVDFRHLVPLLSVVMDKQTLYAVNSISQNIIVPNLVLRLTAGLSNITVVNVTTISTRPFVVLERMNITNATFEFSQERKVFHATLHVCEQQFKVTMLRDTSDYLTFEAGKDRTTSISIATLLSCVEQRKDHRPDISFMLMNSSSARFRLDLLQVIYRLKPKLEIAEMTILLKLPTSWNVLSGASLPTILSNSTVGVKLTNPLGSLVPDLEADVFGRVAVGHPTLVAFPFQIQIPTKAKPISISIQNGERIQVSLANILKLGVMSGAFPPFLVSVLTDIQVTKMTLQFSSNLVGLYQITELEIQIPSKTKWNFPFFYLGQMKLLYTFNHTLLSGQIFLGNLSLPCQLEWSPSSKQAKIELSKPLQMNSISYFVTEICQTFYGRAPLEKYLKGLTKTKLSAVTGISLRRSSFNFASDLSFTKVTFTAVLPKYSWKLLDDFFTVDNISFWVQVDVGKSILMFVRGIIVLVSRHSRIPFEMNVPLEANQTLTISLPENEVPRVSFKQLTGILTGATASRFPIVLGSFLPEFILQRLVISIDQNLTKFEIDEFRAICSTPWDLGGIGAISVVNVTAIMTPQSFKLRGSLLLGNTNLELELKNTSTGQLFSLVKPANTSGLQNLVKDAFTKMIPGLKSVPDASLLGLHITEDSLVQFAEVQFSNNFDSVSSFNLEVRISKAWSFFKSCCSLIAPTMTLRVKDLNDIPSYTLDISSSLELVDNKKRLLLPLECNIPASKRSVITLKLKRAVIFDLSKITVLPLVGKLIPSGLLSPISDVIGNISLWPLEANFEPLTARLIMLTLTATALKQWNLNGFPITLENITLHMNVGRTFNTTLKGMFLLNAYPISFQIRFAPTLPNLPEMRMGFQGFPDISVKEIGQKLIGGFVLENLFPPVFHRVKISMGYLNLRLVPPLRKLQIQSFSLAFSFKDQVTLIDNWLRIENIHTQLKVKTGAQTSVAGRLACLITLGTGDNVIQAQGVVDMPHFSAQAWELHIEPEKANPISALSIVTLVGGGFDLKSLFPDQILSKADKFTLKNFKATFTPNPRFEVFNITCSLEINLTDVWLPLGISIKHMNIQLFVTNPFDAAKKKVKATIFVEIQLGKAIVPTVLSVYKDHILLEIENLKNQPLTMYDLADLIGGKELLMIVPSAFLNFNTVTLNSFRIKFSKPQFQLINASIRCDLHGFDVGFSFPLPLPDPSNIFKAGLVVQYLELGLQRNKDWELTAGIKASFTGIPLANHLSDLQGLITVTSRSATFTIKKTLLDVTVDKELAGINCNLNIRFFDPKIVFASPQEPQISVTLDVTGFDDLNKPLLFKVFRDKLAMDILITEKTGMAIKLKTMPILDYLIPCTKDEDWYRCDFTWLCQKDSYVTIQLPSLAYTQDGFSAIVDVQGLEKLCIPLTLTFFRQFFKKIPFLSDLLNLNLPLWPPPDIIGSLHRIGCNIDNLPKGMERFKSPAFPKEISAVLSITENGPLSFALEVQNDESIDVAIPVSLGGNLAGISLSKFAIGSVFGVPFVDIDVEVYLWDLMHLILLSNLPKNNPLLINAEEMETHLTCKDCFFIIVGPFPIPIFAAPLSIKYATLIGAKAQVTIYHRRPDYRDFGTVASLLVGLVKFYTNRNYLLSKEDFKTANSTLLVLKFSHNNEVTMVQLPKFTGGSRLTLNVPPIDGKMFLIGWMNFYKTLEPKWLLQIVPLRYRVIDTAFNIGPFRWSLLKFAASSAKELKENKDIWPYPVRARGDDALLLASANLILLSTDVEFQIKNFGNAGLSLRLDAGITRLIKVSFAADANVNLGDSSNPVTISSNAMVKLNNLLLLTAEAKVTTDIITLSGELRFNFLGVIRFGGKVAASFGPGLVFVLDANADVYLLGVRLHKSHLYIMSSISKSVVRATAVFMGSNMNIELIRNGLSFNVQAKTKLRILLEVDLGKISVAGLDIGSIVLSTGFDCDLQISFPGRSSLKAAFYFMGIKIELPLLTFDTRDARPDRIPQLLVKFIKDKAPALIKQLFGRSPDKLLKALVEGILDFFGDTAKLLKDLLKAGLNFSIKELGKFLNNLVDAGKAIAEAAKKISKAAAQAAKATREIASKAVEAAGKAVQQAGKIAQQTGRRLAEAGKALVQAVGKVIRIDNAVKEAKRVLKNISKALEDVVNRIGQLAQKILDEIARGLRNLAGKVIKTVSGWLGKRAIYRRDAMTDEKRRKEAEKKKLQRNQSDQRTRIRSKERELERARNEEQVKRNLRDEAQKKATRSSENLKKAFKEEADKKMFFDDIINKGKCVTGENNCHPNATCLRSGSDGQSFRCVCTRGWVGNGTYCERPIRGVAIVSDSPKPVGEEVSFSAFALSGTNVQYKYSFNAAFSQYGFASHVFSSPGVYDVALFARNDVSNASASEVVVVQTPVANITIQILGDRRACHAVHFSPSASGTNVSFNIDFGDNSSLHNITGSVSHYFPRSGVFVINVTASNLVSAISKTFLVNISSSPCDQLFCDIWKLETMFPDKHAAEIASLAWSFLQSLEADTRERRYNRIWKELSLFHPIPYSDLNNQEPSRTIVRQYSFHGSHIELDFLMAGILSSKIGHLPGNGSSFLPPHIKKPLDTFTWISTVLISTEDFISTWNFSKTKEEYCEERLPMSTINSAVDGYIFGARMADLNEMKRLSNYIFDYYCPSKPSVKISWKTRYKTFYNLSKKLDNDGIWDPVIVSSTMLNLTSNLEGFVSPIKEFCLSIFLDLLWSVFNATEFQRGQKEEILCKTYTSCKQCLFSGPNGRCFWCESSKECLSKTTRNTCDKKEAHFTLPCPKTCHLNQRCSECTLQEACGWCRSLSLDERPFCHEGGPEGPRSTALCSSSGWYHETCTTACPLNQGRLCSRKGICKAGKCYCIPGFFGNDCSQEGCVYTAQQNDTLHSISLWSKLNVADIQMANKANFGNATLAFNSHITVPKPRTEQNCLNGATHSKFHPLFPRMLRIAINRAGLHSFCGLFGSLASEKKPNLACNKFGNREQCLGSDGCAWNVRGPCTGMLLEGCFGVTHWLDLLVHQSQVIYSPISGNVNITDDNIQITGWPKSEWEGYVVTVSHFKPYNITSVQGGQIIGTVLPTDGSVLPDFIRVNVAHDGVYKDPLAYLFPCSPGCSQIAHFFNSVCDQACNTKECHYDNGECIPNYSNLSDISLQPRSIHNIYSDTSVKLLYRLQRMTGEKHLNIARGPLSIYSLAKQVVLEMLQSTGLHSSLVFRSYRSRVAKFVGNLISQNASLEKLTLLTAEKIIELGIYQVSPYGRNGADYDIAEITTSSLQNQSRFQMGLEILMESRLLDFTLVENDSLSREPHFYLHIPRQTIALNALNDYDPTLQLSPECNSLSSCSGHGVCMANGSCQCDIYYTGKKCQINNCPGQCSGHGTCIEGICVCNFGWDGDDCSKIKLCTQLCPESWIGDGFCDPDCNTPKCLQDKGDCQDICICPNAWLGDGSCDRTCNTTTCEYDGGDCTKTECSPGCQSEMLADGICDHECNTELCSLDEGDCAFVATCSCNQDLLANGICDEDCNVPSCLYDYGDCTLQVPGDNCPQSCSPPVIGNGFCDISCNVSACNMDGGDCNPATTGMRLCFEGCLPSFRGDGECDSVCNVQPCDFDNGDCPKAIVQECSPKCQMDMVGDGICQSQCQVEECSFDANDCHCAPGCLNTSIGDGICNMECYAESCDYDNMDCVCSSNTCPKEYLGNGQCDEECNYSICDFDSGDCTCSNGCAITSINDGSCDPACDAKVCNFDGLDCGGCESESHLNICDKNAECITSNDAIPYIQCRCKSGFYGDGFSCVERGKCFNDSDICSKNGRCLEANGTFECYCNSGWVGNGIFCENVNECEDQVNNCSINANCVDLPGSYKCVCSAGWIGNGYNCTDINECESNSNFCCENEDCVNTEGNYTCTCKHGWRESGNATSAAQRRCILNISPKCADIDECLEARHNCSTYESQANAICTNTIGGFKCSCNQGWEGDGYFCNDVNECVNGSVCGANQNCRNTPGNYSCSCKNGWALGKSSKECEDVDECTLGLDDCDVFATCINTIGSFKCECMEGFQDKTTICTKYQCGNQTDNTTRSTEANATSASQQLCTCIGEFLNTGKSCVDIDECTLNMFDCPTSAPLCQNLIGGYECKCNAVDNSSCDSVNPCDSSNNTCDQNMTCIAVGMEHYCVCPDGYTEDENGTACVDVDECINPQFYGSCDNNADCVNLNGSFECKCRSGFFQSGDACFEIDECEKTITQSVAGRLEECKAGVCASTETCIFSNSSRDSRKDTNTTLVCACDDNDNQKIDCIEAIVRVIQSGKNFTTVISIPWFATANTSSNTNINNRTFHNCTGKAICKNTAGSYECICQKGYQIDDGGWTCHDTDECIANNTCHSNATCFNTDGSFNCECKSGFTGNGLNNCTDIDECALKAGNCTNNSICVNTIGGHFCACVDGFKRNGTLCEDLDECSSRDLNNCHPRASCHNYVGGYNCTCISGYGGNGLSCSDIDECKGDSIICGAHASCYNTLGSYKCKCDPGWSGNGLNCANIDECSLGLHTCIENSYCTDNQGSYTCTCDRGWVRQWFEPYGRCSRCDPITFCSGHGQCLRNGTCDCLSHYKGTNCSVCRSDVRCSGHGTCDFNGNCYCEHGWTRQPLDCSICLSETLCSGHGTCNYDLATYNNKSCFCDDKYFGKNCSNGEKLFFLLK